MGKRIFGRLNTNRMQAALYHARQRRRGLLDVAVEALKLFFNGTDQYVTHSAFTSSGVMFTAAVTITPNDDPSSTEIFTDFLSVNSSGQLVVSYTDTAAAAQSVVLTSPVLISGTEYAITVSSDGNGVFLSLPDGPQIAENPAIGTGWVDDGGGEYSYNANDATFLTYPTALEVGSGYRLRFTLANRTGNGNVGFSSSGFAEPLEEKTLTANGELDTILFASGTSLRIFFALGAGTGTISDISVTKVFRQNNPAVVNPSTVAIDRWAANAAANGGFFPGKISDVVLTDLGLPSGDYLTGNGADLYVTIPKITFNGDFRISGKFYFDSAGEYTEWLSSFSQPSGIFIDVSAGDFRFFGYGSNDILLFLVGSVDWQKESVCTFEASRIGSVYQLKINGKITGSTTAAAEPVSIDNLHRRDTAYSRDGHIISIDEIADLDTGDTYQYLLNNIIDNGDGTGIAPNTGSVEEYGPELVYNGEFDSSADWIVRSPWVISGGTLSVDGSQTSTKFTSQDIDLVDGAYYKVDIKNLQRFGSSGQTLIFLGAGNPFNLDASVEGDVSIIASASTSVNSEFYIGALAAGEISIDSVSVRQTANGIVNSYSGTDTATIDNDSRSYAVANPPDESTLSDSVSGEDATIQNYDAGMWQ